jgi:CheY-like chemotaxis protein
MKILVLDDDRAIIDSVSLSQRNADYVCAKCVNGVEEAVGYIEECRPDIVYLDHDFDESNDESGTGIDAVKHFIRADRAPWFISTTSNLSSRDQYEEMDIPCVSKIDLHGNLKQLALLLLP